MSTVAAERTTSYTDLRAAFASRATVVHSRTSQFPDGRASALWLRRGVEHQHDALHALRSGFGTVEYSDSTRDALREALKRDDVYVLISFDTVVAWWTATDGVVVDPAYVGFSSTTSRQINNFRRALG